MVNVTFEDYEKFRVACPKCNNQIYSWRISPDYDRYCKKCNYRAGFYYSKSKDRFVNYEMIYGSREPGTKHVSIKIVYPHQTAVITVLYGGIMVPSSIAGLSQQRQEYTMPLKDEYFDDNCFIRIDSLDDVVRRFRKLGVMR